MSEVSGELEVYDARHANLRIRLDGDLADVWVGGTGRGGLVNVCDDAGDTGISLVAGGDRPILTLPGAGPSIQLAAPTGLVQAGGGGVGGHVVAAAADGKARVTLDGAGGNVWVGGNGTYGDLLLLPIDADSLSTDQATIHLDAQGSTARFGRQDLPFLGFVEQVLIDGRHARIQLQVATGEDGLSDLVRRVYLDAESGNFYLGGGGQDGDIVLFPSTGDNKTTSQATIHLDAQAGDIKLQNADCAEDFDLCDECDAEPGTVMVIDRDGRLRPGARPYDTRVAGVVSGAGDLRPGIVLGRRPDGAGPRRASIALLGKAHCKVDADFAPIEEGDLLTTSDTPGHAMKVADPTRAVGAMLGKALQSLDHGVGFVPILVGLR